MLTVNMFNDAEHLTGRELGGLEEGGDTGILGFDHFLFFFCEFAKHAEVFLHLLLGLRDENLPDVCGSSVQTELTAEEVERLEEVDEWELGDREEIVLIPLC